MGESLQGFAPFFLLEETNMNTNLKTLVRYILPALGGLFVTYLYNVVDGIFVGQGIGSAALGGGEYRRVVHHHRGGGHGHVSHGQRYRRCHPHGAGGTRRAPTTLS